MRHHAKHIAIFIHDAGDVVHRAVRIGAFGIAEHHLAIAFDACQRFGVGEIVAVMVRHRAADDLALMEALVKDVLALATDSFTSRQTNSVRCCADQGAGHAGFQQDLEAVAHANDHHALVSLLHTASITGERAAIAPQRK